MTDDAVILMFLAACAMFLVGYFAGKPAGTGLREEYHRITGDPRNKWRLILAVVVNGIIYLILGGTGMLIILNIGAGIWLVRRVLAARSAGRS